MKRCLTNSFGLSKDKTSKDSSNSINDESVLKSAQKELDVGDVGPYEVSSITSLDETKTTTIIVDTGSANIALEIDQNSGRIVNKEKLLR